MFLLVDQQWQCFIKTTQAESREDSLTESFNCHTIWMFSSNTGLKPEKYRKSRQLTTISRISTAIGCNVLNFIIETSFFCTIFLVYFFYIFLIICITVYSLLFEKAVQWTLFTSLFARHRHRVFDKDAPGNSSCHRRYFFSFKNNNERKSSISNTMYSVCIYWSACLRLQIFTNKHCYISSNPIISRSVFDKGAPV
jgi:hypothetical protein